MRSLKTFDEYTQEEIDAKLAESAKDIAEGRVYTMEQADAMMAEILGSWKN